MYTVGGLVAGSREWNMEAVLMVLYRFLKKRLWLADSMKSSRVFSDSIHTYNSAVEGCCGRYRPRSIGAPRQNFWVDQIAPSTACPPLPFFSFTFPSISFPSRPLKVGLLNTAKWSVEHCKLLQQCLGRSLSVKRIWCILALKTDIWWHRFLPRDATQSTVVPH